MEKEESRERKSVVIQPNIDNKVKLRVKGLLDTGPGLLIAARLNGFVAHWNTLLERNKPSSPNRKISSSTDRVHPPLGGLKWPRREPSRRARRAK